MGEKIEYTVEMMQKHEEEILTNRAVLKDFMVRYDRDKEECKNRYKDDRDEARLWREHFDRKLSDIEIFIAQMKPNYKLAIYFIGTVIMGALGLIFKVIWDHTTHLN